MIRSTLTSEAQTTIPEAVRTALSLRAGDDIVYLIEDQRVIIARAAAPSSDDPFATFREWASLADQRAYGKL